MTKIHLANGEDIFVGMRLEDLISAFNEALASNQLWKVIDSDEAIYIAVNPRQVLYFQEGTKQLAPDEATAVQDRLPQTAAAG